MDQEFSNYIKSLKEKAGQKLGMLGVWRFTLEDVITGEREVQYYHNVIPIVGRTMIANNLVDAVPDNDMLLNYAALGTDATAVSENDTQLGTETYRNEIASKTNAANIAYVTAYYSQTECNGTYKEAGIFSDATAAANSGILVSHVNIDVTKTNTQKLTVDWTLELLSA
jgi:hypothetical protein